MEQLQAGTSPDDVASKVNALCNWVKHRPFGPNRCPLFLTSRGSSIQAAVSWQHYLTSACHQKEMYLDHSGKREALSIKAWPTLGTDSSLVWVCPRNRNTSSSSLLIPGGQSLGSTLNWQQSHSECHRLTHSKVFTWDDERWTVFLASFSQQTSERQKRRLKIVW